MYACFFLFFWKTKILVRFLYWEVVKICQVWVFWENIAEMSETGTRYHTFLWENHSFPLTQFWHFKKRLELELELECKAKKRNKCKVMFNTSKAILPKSWSSPRPKLCNSPRPSWAWGCCRGHGSHWQTPGGWRGPSPSGQPSGRAPDPPWTGCLKRNQSAVCMTCSQRLRRELFPPLSDNVTKTTASISEEW